MHLLVAVNSMVVLTFVCTLSKEFTMDTRIQFRVDEETKIDTSPKVKVKKKGLFN